MADEVRDLEPVAPAPVTGEQAKPTPTEAEAPQAEAEPKADGQEVEASDNSASDDEAATESGESSSEDEDGTDGEEKPKKLSRSQRERRAKIRAIERAEFAEREAAELRRRIAERETPPQPRQKTNLDPTDPEPTLDDFQNTIDPNGFHKLAHDQWRLREAQRSREDEGRKGREASEQKQREFQSRLAAFEDDHEAREDEAREVIPDYDAVSKRVPKGLLQHAPEIVLQIAQSEKSALLQYHFGKNPDALEKIARLAQRDVLGAARELWRVESRLSLPQSNKTTKAPPPLKPPSGGGASPPVDIRKLAESDDITEFARAMDAIDKKRK